ncbi:MAG: hemolysin family protein [Deltaproteobacteria bacterium]|nr:hemolysin family protein [Deltaproteobacteria bacterium]
MESITYLLILLVCLVGAAFFAGSETALLRLTRADLDEDAKTPKGPGVLAARELLTSLQRLLVTVLLGQNIVNTLGAAVASALAVRYLGDGWGIVVATIIMTVVTFLFGEVMPKAVAASHPKRIAYMVALPLYLLHQLLRPLHILYDKLVDPLIERLAGAADSAPQMSSTEELMRLARGASENTGTGGDRPIGIIAAAARAVDMTVADILVPRTEVVGFSADTPPAELLKAVLEEGYTRVPIYEGSIDRVLGVAHLKDLVELERDARGDLRRILRPVLQVPERKRILELLTDMQNAFVHFAIVKDEFGVTLGIVTQEDILEELVGEIRDEFDRDELLTIRQVAPGRYQALGRVKVRDFNRQTGWKVPAEPGDTLAGLVFNTLGRTPRRGESIALPGYDIVVTDLARARVTQVQVIERPETAAAATS